MCFPLPTRPERARGPAARPAPRAAPARGFTLIEAALTTVIIGVGVLAIVEAQHTFLRTNDWSSQAATGTYLANEIREMTRPLARHDPVTGLYLADGGAGTVLHGWGREPGEVGVDDLDDLDDFDGLVFRFDGTPSITDNDLPGPVDAFGNVIPEILASGSAMLDAEGLPVPLQGWSQHVRVEKLDPFNSSVPRAASYFEPAQGTFEGRAVDQYPLRVTVQTRYLGRFDTEPRSIASVVWIVP